MLERRPRTAVAIAVFTAAVLIGAGVFLLVQRQTGTRALATVGDCVSTGGGRWASTHCTGSWVVGGPLLEGGHVVVGTIQGVEESSVGKTVEVTLRGDEAYSRGLALPLLLVGLGLVMVAATAIIIRGSRRRTGNRPALPG